MVVLPNYAATGKCLRLLLVVGVDVGGFRLEELDFFQTSLNVNTIYLSTTPLSIGEMKYHNFFVRECTSNRLLHLTLTVLLMKS